MFPYKDKGGGTVEDFWNVVSVGQPGSNLARKSLEFRTGQHFIKNFPCESGLIRSHTINAEIKLPLHIFDSVHGPRVNLLAARVSLSDDPAIESILLYAEEIDI